MEHIYTPWRMNYIKSRKKTEGCVFCSYLEEEDSPENLVAYRGTRAFVILNRYPYTSGHLMVLPYDHQSSLAALSPETRSELIEIATQAQVILQQLYNPDGFNMGINSGKAAGAGLAEHIHIHVVPRWQGDSNFMAATGQTRILPETLDQTWERVHTAWARKT